MTHTQFSWDEDDDEYLELYHVYPCDDEDRHIVNQGTNCWCEPEIEYVYDDLDEDHCVGAIVIHKERH